MQLNEHLTMGAGCREGGSKMCVSGEVCVGCAEYNAQKGVAKMFSEIYGFTMEMRSNNSKFEIALKLIYIYFSLQRIRKPYGSQC